MALAAIFFFFFFLFFFFRVCCILIVSMRAHQRTSLHEFMLADAGYRTACCCHSIRPITICRSFLFQLAITVAVPEAPSDWLPSADRR
jgi:hypothetical protein